MMEIRPVPQEYREECTHGGRILELQVPDFSAAAVYLPYGYDDSERKYDVFYLLHGGGGNPYSFFAEDGVFKNQLDHMIDRGEMRPLIVVAPTYYPPGYSQAGIAYSAEAVKDFGPVLMDRIFPLVDRTFRTIPEREHRGIGGFSMGAVATWYALLAGLDFFEWFMPLSGDCWICGERGGNKHARQTAELLRDSIRGRTFHLYVLTGAKDIAFPNLDPQMKTMEEFSDVFMFGKNTFYGVLEEGVHDYPDIRRYIYNALPNLFTE